MPRGNPHHYLESSPDIDSSDKVGIRNTLFWTTFVKYTDDIWPTNTTWSLV